MGFSGTGVMQTEPDSLEKAELARTAISTAIGVVRIVASQKEL